MNIYFCNTQNMQKKRQPFWWKFTKFIYTETQSNNEEADKSIFLNSSGWNPTPGPIVVGNCTVMFVLFGSIVAPQINNVSVHKSPTNPPNYMPIYIYTTHTRRRCNAGICVFDIPQFAPKV